MSTYPFASRSVVAAALAVAAASLAASAVDARQNADSRERTLFVSAVNSDGEPVDGLGPEAFVITEDGRRREVLRVSRATEPIDLALLVDNSQAAAAIVTFLRDSLPKFAATMGPGNQIAVITLADRPTISTDYTSDPKRISDALGRVFSMSQSGTTFLDGVFEAAAGLRKRETPRAVITAVVTDGTEFTNRFSKDVVRALTEARVALHAVTIGSFYYSDEHGIRERTFLIDAGTRQSGGQRISLLSPHGLDSALRKLARELKSQYKVVYGRPQSLIPPEKIEVSSGRKDVTMRGTPARGGNGA